LADSTHPPVTGRRLAARLTPLALTLIALLAAVHVPAAHADGDPASDVLAEQTVFIPAGTSFPAADQAQLRAVVVAARKAGYPIRVALIATRSDLGAITPLWRNPKGYARFLGEELPDVYDGALLVVMPNGYGVWIVSKGNPPEAELNRLGASLEGAPIPGSGPATAAAAVTAVRRMAASAGHPLPAPTATALPAAGGSSGPGPIAIAALVLGVGLIAAAWTASLRARPWRSGERVPSPSNGA
jgi:hypothetical protein